MSAERKIQVVLALLDMSGSMQGQALATTQIQVQEMNSNLQMGYEHILDSIYFGIYKFGGNDWIMAPKPIDQIDNLPVLQIHADADGLYPRIRYSKACRELLEVLHTLNNDKVKKVHLILFTDGLLTDQEKHLKDIMKQMKADPLFNKLCIRYVVNDNMDSQLMNMNHAKWFLEEFASSKSDVVGFDDYSGLLSKIRATLSDIEIEIPHSFF